MDFADLLLGATASETPVADAVDALPAETEAAPTDEAAPATAAPSDADSFPRPAARFDPAVDFDAENLLLRNTLESFGVRAMRLLEGLAATWSDCPVLRDYLARMRTLMDGTEPGTEERARVEFDMLMGFHAALEPYAERVQSYDMDWLEDLERDYPGVAAARLSCKWAVAGTENQKRVLQFVLSLAEQAHFYVFFRSFPAGIYNSLMRRSQMLVARIKEGKLALSSLKNITSIKRLGDLVLGDAPAEDRERFERIMEDSRNVQPMIEFLMNIIEEATEGPVHGDVSEVAVDADSIGGAAAGGGAAGGGAAAGAAAGGGRRARKGKGKGRKARG